MSDRTPEPTELIYLAGDSWAPPLIAAGVAICVASAFTTWWWVVVGAFILLLGLRSWWRQSDDEISRMRVEQETGTAVIPAEPIRRKA
jgi:hypothetical protein